jgi:hypothetical protein
MAQTKNIALSCITNWIDFRTWTLFLFLRELSYLLVGVKSLKEFSGHFVNM